MIFGKEYDLSLWYMLKVKNIYRKKTIDFVKEVPEEFLENIKRTYINGIENNAGVDDDYNLFYNIQSDNDTSVYYKFYIMCRDLYMYKIKTIDGKDKKLFSLTLSPNNPTDIMNMKKNKKRTLGSICIGEYSQNSFKEVDYNIKKTEFGYMLLHNHVLLMNMLEMKFLRPTSTKYMPEEMWRDKPYQKRLIKKTSNDIYEK